MRLINPDSTHWYTRDGRAMHTVKDKRGNDRATTLRDARKLDLLPSVTAVLGIIAKEQLVAWKIEQALLSALTLPRMENEPLDSYAQRVVEDSQDRTNTAMEFGTDFHAGAQRVALNPAELQDSEPAYPWLVYYRDWLSKAAERVIWAERILVNSPEGYAGTADLLMVHRSHGLCLVDIKTQGVKDSPRIYPSWCYQLAAYRAAIGKDLRCLNLVVNSAEPGPVTEHVWSLAELQEGWEVFRSAHRIWRFEKNFDPRRAETQPINVLTEITRQTALPV
jgi:hypothetical protein